MRVADIEFVNARNANTTGVGSKLVADDTLVFFNLRGIKDHELEEILNYKSFMHTSWKEGKRKISFVYKYGFGPDSKVVWCYSGFSTILIRLLQNKYGYTINGKELYKAKEIVKLPNMLYSLWDFQRDAVEAWIKSGCYGILQCPTSSGKSIIACSIIKKMNVRTIILCHTSDLLINVWFNYLTQQFGEEIKDRIGIIGGGLSKKDRKSMRICDDDFFTNIKKDIVVATSQSLLHGDKLTMLGEEHFGLCLHKNSFILTLNRGVQKIKDIIINDEVLTHRGRFMKVNNVIKREYNGNMLKIIPSKLKIPLLLTPEHPVLAVRTSLCQSNNKSYNTNGTRICKQELNCYYEKNGKQYKQCNFYNGYEPFTKYKLEWTEAKNLKKGDYVAYPISQEKECDINKIEIKNYIDNSLNIYGYDKNQLSIFDYLDKTEFSNNIPKKVISMNNPKAKKLSQIPAEIELTKELMRLFGYFIAEGSIGDNRQLIFVFNANENEYINDVENLMKNIFEVETEHVIDVIVDEKLINIHLLRYSNKILSNMFQNMFCPKEYETKKGKGKKSNIVRIPPEFLNLPLDKLKELIKGIWRGDGGKGTKGTSIYNIKTTSETLAYQLVYILSKFNILPSLRMIDYSKKEDKNWANQYLIEILGKDVHLFDHIIDEKHLNKENIGLRNSKYIKKPDMFYMQIENIENIIYDDYVYNLQVDEDNSYVSSIVIHNCIVDEAHHYSAEQFKKVSGAIRAAYRLGLSATLIRSDGLSPIFYALLGDIRYRIGIKELAKKGLLVEPIFYSIIIEDEESCHKIRNCKYKLLEYSRYVKKVSGSSELKFRYILGLCQSLQAKGRKFMLYTDFVNKLGIDENGEFTIDNDVYTRDEYVKGLLQLRMKVVGISSEMSGVERQSIFTKLGNNELDGIVFGSLGSEGINIPSVEAIILANATASTIRYPQRVGRAMRLYKNKKNCFVYEILLNVEKELQWSEKNFLEYGEQGFSKEIIHVNNDGYLIKKDIKEIKIKQEKTK